MPVSGESCWEGRTRLMGGQEHVWPRNMAISWAPLNTLSVFRASIWAQLEGVGSFNRWPHSPDHQIPLWGVTQQFGHFLGSYQG